MAFFLLEVAGAQVSAPVFNPTSGVTRSAIGVIVTCTTGSSTIYYTTNGQNPTQSDQTVASGSTVLISQSGTLKARAFTLSGSSSVTSAVYDVTGMVAAGPAHMVALRFDGRVFSWGNQAEGALGNGVTTSGTVSSPAPLFKTGTNPFTNVAEVSAGTQVTLILEDTGTNTAVWAAGSNDYGQIGDNTNTDRGLPVAVLSPAGSGTLTGISQVAAGGEFSLALEGSGSMRVYSWGAAVYGRLGNNATSGQRKYPGFVLEQASGNPPIGSVTEIAAGRYFGAALHSDGTVSTWGQNNAGQLARGDTANKDRADKALEWVSLGSQPTLTGVVAIAAGTEHMLVIRSGTSYNGAVWAWGEQQYGALGNGETSSQAKKYAFPVIKDNDLPLDEIEQIAAGESVSLALSSSGTVWAWGRNNTGAVGTGTTGNVSKARVISVSGTVPVVWIATGGTSGATYSLALDQNGILYAWGNNAGNVLGTGTATTVLSPTVSGTAVWVNRAPTATLSLTGAPFTAPATVTLGGTYADADGNLVGVRFYQNSSLLVTDTTSPYQHVVNGVMSGTYVFGATAFDSAGATTSVTGTLGIPLPTVSVTGTPSTILENSGSSATFRISRDVGDSTANPLTVNFTLTGTAINGGDFTTVSPLSATIASGSTTAVVTISPINDYYIEGDENVLMTLTTSATSYNIQTGTAAITITEPTSRWIEKVSGDSQFGAPDAFLNQPFVVEVRTGSGGSLLVNAPVLFTVASGSGGLASAASGTGTSTLTINTGTDGRAQAYYRQSSVMAVTSTITAVSGSSSTASFTSETAAGLWSRWPFNEGSGTTANEATGQGGNGTLTNSPSWTTGFDGDDALSFSGSASYVTMGSPTGRSLDLGTGDFSVAFWVKYTDVPGSGQSRRIVGKGSDGWGPGYFVGLKGDGKLAVGLGATSGTQSAAVLFKTTGALNNGQWRHVVATVDRTNANARIYVDGVAQALEKEDGTGGTVSGTNISLSGLSNLNASGTGAPFTIASLSGTGAYFKGEVDDVQVHRSALTVAEVADIYNVDADNGGSGDGLPDRWEWKYFGNLVQSGTGNYDGDLLTNAQEYSGASDPTDYYNGALPIVQKDSGDSQVGVSGNVLANPLVVKVMTSGSVALENAPVAFSISGSNGQIATSGTGSFSTTQNIVTGTGGTAAVYLQLSGTVGALNQVQAQMVSGTGSVSVTFSATTRAPAAVNIVGGNNQAGPPSTYLEEPLVVEVRSGSGGALLIGEPVLFSVASGSGALSTTFGGTVTSGTLAATTGTDGRARAYYLQSSGTAVTSTITVTSGTTGSASFTEKTTQADGLWAHWKLDEDSGTTAADATGLTVSGTLVNSPTWDEGFDSRGGAKFAGFTTEGGSNSYISMGNPSDRSLDFGVGSFSISCWVKFTDGTFPGGQYGRRIISKGHHGFNAGYTLVLEGDGCLWTGIGSTLGSASSALFFRTQTEYDDGKWHHIAVIFDRQNATAQIYVDGVAQPLAKHTGSGGTVDPMDSTVMTYPSLNTLSATRADMPLTISSHQGSYDFFKGEVDDVRIYRKALSSTDVESLHEFDGDGDDLPDWWEWQYLQTLSQDDTGNDDNDSRNNLAEYTSGSDPKDYYNGELPVLQKLSGDSQTGENDTVLANPLVVKVMTSGSAALESAPVAFSISGSHGQLSATGTGTFSSTLSVVTGTASTASVYLKVTGSGGALNQVQAQVATGTASTAVTFSATTQILTSGSLSIVSGNSQVGRANEYLTSPLTVEVRSGTMGTLAINAPVTYVVTSGSGGLATQFGGTVTSGTLTVNTGSNGRAKAYFQQAADATSSISATTGTSTVVFTSTRAGGDAWSSWTFDDGYGVTALETTGLGANGTLSNDPHWSAGFDGMGAVEFTGSNSYVTMGQPTGRSLDLGTESFTVAFWVRYTEVPGSSETFRIVSKGFESFGPGYFVGLRGDGKLAAGLGSTSGTSSSAVLFKTTGSFNDGEWHAVAAVYDRTNGVAQIYVDGTSRTLEKEAGTGGAVTSGTLSLSGLSTLNASGTATPFTVSSFSGSSQFFQGEVDQVEIHKTALSSSAVEEIYNADLDGNELPDWWEFKHFQFVGVDPDDDFDNDGLSNADEYEEGGDPKDYYSQGETTITPVLTMVSGDNQTSGPDQFLPEPLVIEVLSGTIPLAKAPVVLTVASGSGGVASSLNGVTGTTTTIYTGSNGRASAWYRQGSVVNVTSTIAAQAGDSNVIAFNASTLGINSLVGHWKFDEGTGTTAADSAPFVHTGTLLESPTWEERFDGESSLVFSGSGAHVLTLSGSDGVLDFEEADFSVTAWIKSGTVPVAGRIVSKGNENANPGYYVALNAQGQIETGLGTTQTGTTAETVRIKTTGSFNDNAWHAVAAVYDRRNSTAKIYVDGTVRVIAKEAGSGGTINVSGSNSLDYPTLAHLTGSGIGAPLIIASQSGTSAFFQGGIDEVRVHRKALSAEEVLELYAEEGELMAVPAQLTIPEDTLGTLVLQSNGGGDDAPEYEIVTSSTNGTLELAGATVNYYANAHFSGTDSFRFRVTKGPNTDEADVNIVVAPVDDPPLVSVGGGRSVSMSGTTAILVLSATVTDIDTDPEQVSLEWMGSGTAPVIFTGTNPLTATATFSAAGEYLLRLFANDGATTRSDSLLVTVNPSGTATLPSVSLVEPDNDTAYELNEAILFQASASAASGSTITKVEFYAGSQKIGEDTTPDSSTGFYELSWTPPRIGIFPISAKVSDSAGNKVFSSSLQVRATQGGWFTDSGATGGNEGYAGSGGNGGVAIGSSVGSGGSYEPNTGGTGGGSVAAGGGDGFGNPLGTDLSNVDSDNDGLSDKEETEYGTIGVPGEDYDGDKLNDAEDAVPYDPNFVFRKSPESRYVALILGEDTEAIDINKNGEILLRVKSGANIGYSIWKSGQLYAVPLVTSTILPQLADDGTVVGTKSGFTGIYSWKIGGAPQEIVSVQSGSNFTVGGTPYGSSYSAEAKYLTEAGTVYYEYIKSIWREETSESEFLISGTATTETRTCNPAQLNNTKISTWKTWPIAEEEEEQFRENTSGTEGIVAADCGTAENAKLVLKELGFLSCSHKIKANGTATHAGLVSLSTIAGPNLIESSSSSYYDYLGGNAPDLGPILPTLFKNVCDVSELSHVLGSETTFDTVLVGSGPSASACAWIAEDPMKMTILRDGTRPAIGPATGINIRGEIVLGGGNLWRNGKVHKIRDLIGSKEIDDFDNLQIKEINDRGLMVMNALRKFQDGQPLGPGEQKSHAVLLVPVDMAVDANRDGFIKFAGNHADSSLAGKPADETSKDRPFRFWINDDDEAYSPGPDSLQPVVPNIRDLEDYARLHIYIDAFKSQFESGDYQIGLEWRDTEGSNPSIKVGVSVEPDGGILYLTDRKVAEKQLCILREVKAGLIAKFEKSVWTQGNARKGVPSRFPNCHLIFQGVNEGRGRLVLTIWKGAQKIGEGGSVWLDLMNIKKMYVRAKGTPETNIDAPWDDAPSLNTGFVSDPNGHEFLEPQDEEKKVLIYVHGIHAPFAGQNASYLGNVDVAETVYKRLWHAGYKGRFALYKWPALNPAGFFISGTGFEFNQSEYRAWKYGKGLSAFATSMPGDYQRHVFAHSQGNAVVAAAFRDYSLAATTWVITQGAIPISCYDDNTAHIVFPYTTPDLAADMGYRGYLKDQVSAKVVNFFNTRDRVTGQTWEANQSLFKPTIELVGLTRIEYKYYAGSGETRLQKYFASALLSDRAVTDLHESMAMIVKSRSKAIGQGATAAGEVNVGVDMYADFGFDNEHGSQWDRAIQENITLYFERLLDEIE